MYFRLTLRTDELTRYRASVIACSFEGERELCERLLGQVASLEAQAAAAAPDSELSFAPAPGTAELAQRALEHLRTKPLRSRFRREPVGSMTERRRARH